MVAPGTTLREGIDNIVHARTGGLIIVGEVDELSFLFSGGIKLEIDYTPALLYQIAKMDGAIVLNANATRIAMANVQLMPDPTILSLETGTRHRTAERVSKQTDALVIAISQRREVVSLYVDGGKYILEEIPVVLAKANQALATLDKYRTRLDQVSTRLTALEFEGGATLHDVLTVLQRAELVTRMAVEIERYIVELGTEGRLIEMQLEETMVGTAADKAALVHDYLAENTDEAFAGALDQSAACRTTIFWTSAASPSCSATTASSTPLTTPCLHAAFASSGASRGCRSSSWHRSSPISAGSTRCSPRPTPSWRRSTGWARSGRRTSARAFGGCRRSTSWTGTCRRDAGPSDSERRGRPAPAPTIGGHHFRSDRRAAAGGPAGPHCREHRVRAR
jgi:DNA integrity scanning protein DisA with diadenylate cyclase activity